MIHSLLSCTRLEGCHDVLYRIEHTPRVIEVIQLSSGFAFHFGEKYAQPAFEALKLISPKFTDDEANAFILDFLRRGNCDLGLFMYMFRRLFPSKQALQSPLAHLTLTVGSQLRSRLHTHKSERGHARERVALMAASAPGRAFHHHSRSDMLAQTN